MEEDLVKANNWQWVEKKYKLWSDFKNRDWISNPLEHRKNSQEWAPRESDIFTQRAKATHKSERKRIEFCMHSTFHPRSYTSRCNCPSIWLLCNIVSSWVKGTNSCSDWRSTQFFAVFMMYPELNGIQKLTELSKGKMNLAWINSDFLPEFPSCGSWGWPRHFL